MVKAVFCALITILLLAGRSAAQMPDVLYLRFEEGTGLTTADFAVPGIGSSANLTPACALTIGNAPIGQGAMQMGVVALDGCLIANPVVPATTTFTIEFWMELTPSTQNYAFSNYCAFGPPPLFCGIAYASPPSTYGINLQMHGITVGLQATLPPAVGNWRHMAIVSDSSLGAIRIYANALLISTTPVSSFLPLTAYMTSGFNVGGGLSPTCFGGVTTTPAGLDDFRIWSTARTQAEIAAAFAVDLLTGGDFLGASVAPSLILDPAQGTLAATGTIDRGGNFSNPFPLSNIALPAGTTITVTGNYVGNDLTTLSDVTASPCSVRISAVPNADELIVQGVLSAFAGPAPTAVFSGSSSLVVTRRALTSVGAPVVTRIGQGSPALDAFASRLQQASTWSMILDCGFGAPRVLGVVADFVPPITPPESRLTTDGLGSVLLGDVGMAPSARILHFFALQPTIPVGTGPFLGIEPNPSVLVQMNMPFPSTPFKVAANAAGAYMFLTGPGTLPPSLTVDTITIELLPPAFGTIGFISTPRRVVF